MWYSRFSACPWASLVLSPATEPCPSSYTRTAIKHGTPFASSPMIAQGVSACEPIGNGCCTLQLSPPVSIIGHQADVSSSHQTRAESNMRTEATDGHAKKDNLLEQDLCMAKCGYACTLPSQLSSNTNPGEEAATGSHENPRVPVTKCSPQAIGYTTGTCTCPSVAKDIEAIIAAPASSPAAARFASRCRRTSLSPLQSGTGAQQRTPSPTGLIGQETFGDQDGSPMQRMCSLPTNQNSKPADLSTRLESPTQTDGAATVSPTAKSRYDYCARVQHCNVRCGEAPSIFGMSPTVAHPSALPRAPVRLVVSARGDVCASPFPCSCHMHPRQAHVTDAPGCIPLSSLKGAETYAKLPNREFADGVEHEQARGAASALPQRNAPGSLVSHLSTAEPRSTKHEKRVIWDSFESRHQSISLQHADGAREEGGSLHSHRSSSPAVDRAGCSLRFSCVLPAPPQSGLFRSCIQAQQYTPFSGGACEAYCCAPLQTESRQGRIRDNSPLPERSRHGYPSIQESGLTCRAGAPGPQVNEHVNANQVAAAGARHPPATESQGLTTAQQLLLELERLSEPSLPSSPSVYSPPTLAATLTPAVLTPSPPDKVAFAENVPRPQAKQQDIQAGVVTDATCHTRRAPVAETVPAARIASPLPHLPENCGLVYATRELSKTSEEMREGHRLKECSSIQPRSPSAKAQQSTGVSTFRQSPPAPQSGTLKPTPSSPPHPLKESFTFCDVSSSRSLIPLYRKEACRSPPPSSAVSSLIAGQKETDQRRIPAILWTITEAPTVVTEVTSQPASLSAQGLQLPISPHGQGGSNETHSTSAKEHCGSQATKDVVPQLHIVEATTSVCRHTTSPRKGREARRLLQDEAEAHRTSRSPSLGRNIAMRLVNGLRRAVHASRSRRRSTSPSQALYTRSVTELVVADMVKQQGAARSLAELLQHPPALSLSQKDSPTGVQACAFLQRAHCDPRERARGGGMLSIQGQQQHTNARPNEVPMAHGTPNLPGGTFQQEKRTVAQCNNSSCLHTAACFEPLRFSTSNSHYRPPPTDIVSLPKSLASSSPRTKFGGSPAHYMGAGARSRYLQHTSPTRTSVWEALKGARRAVEAANSALESSGAQKIASGEKRGRRRYESFPDRLPISTRQLGHLPAPVVPPNFKAVKLERRQTGEASSDQRPWTTVQRAELNQWRQLLERNRELQRRRG